MKETYSWIIYSCLLFGSSILCDRNVQRRQLVSSGTNTSMARSCILPSVEGVVYTYENSNESLSHGTLIDHDVIVNENCEVGYHNVNPDSFRTCTKNGKWKKFYDKLCLKMCPPLLSDSLEIKCSYKGKYTNCSNLLIPDTIAKPKCKPDYAVLNGIIETPLELHCQSNGMWNNQLYRCNPSSSCVLPTVEGVVYTYEDSNATLSHGTLIDYGVTVIENCELGYQNVYPNSFRICQKNGKWRTVSDELCLKMPCVLPSVEGVVYTYENSNESLSHGTLIDHDVIVNENCEVGYHNVNPYSFRTCTKNGKWKKFYDKLCLKMCPPLLSDSLEIKCSYKGKYTNCSNLSIPDTIAIPKCKPDYAVLNGIIETPLELHCQSNGMWNNQLYTCNPSISCVLPTVEGVIYTYEDSNATLAHGTLIDYGVTVIENCELGYQNVYPNSFRICQKNGKWRTDSDELCLKCGRPFKFIETQTLIRNVGTEILEIAPWSVPVFKKISNYEFHCDGSIISRNLVITAAHCFWEKGMPHTIIIFDNLYIIGVDKFYKHIYMDTDPQIMNVDRIHMKEGYNGLHGYYADDIAIVVLKNSIAFQNGITPICIDWRQKYIVSNGDKGQIVSLVNTGKDIESPILLQTDMPYIDLTTCREMCTAQQEFDSYYVTPDKFCAGPTSDTEHDVQYSNYGESLYFSHSEFYYLTGVENLVMINKNNSITVYTSVGYHIRWIEKLYIYYKNVQYN